MFTIIKRLGGGEKMKLKVIYGSSCSGKSTYVNDKIKDNDIKFDYDLLMQSVSNRGSHEYSDDHLPYIVEMRNMLINDPYKDEKIENIYIIATKLTDKLYEQLEGKDVDFQKMSTSKKQCLDYLEKDDSRPDKSFWKERIDEWFKWDEEVNEQREVMKMNKEEVRTLSHSVEIRSDDDEKMSVKGYALKFNKWSHDLGGFKETVSSKALKNTPMEDVRALFNHDPQKVLGRTSNESLKLEVDDTGLRFELELPNTTYARDLYENLKIGNIDKCSYGFRVGKNGDEVRFNKDKNIYERTVNDISALREISVVSFPAFEDTVVSVRSVDEAREEHKEMDALKLEMYSIRNNEIYQ